MRTLWIGILLFLLPVFTLKGQIEFDKTLPAIFTKDASKLPRKELPPIDTAQKGSKTKDIGHKAYDFAYVHHVDLSPSNFGTWRTLPDGARIWQGVVHAEGAYSLNFTFNPFSLPPGAKLYLYTPGKEDIAGAFTARNNKLSGKLAVRPLAGDEVIIAYYEPAGVAKNGRFKITRIGHDYKNAFGEEETTSQYCEVNINCSEGDEWQLEKRAVAKIVIDNSRICTGALVNNTSSNGTPYFLTASHCIGNDSEARNTVFFFNYESKECTGSEGSLAQSLSGSELKATAPGSNQDFTLVALTETPPAEYKPYYAGWDRGQDAPESTVTIHHPDGDIKKISIDNDSPITGDYGAGYDENTHWLIQRWDVGATEGGSSGSPLFSEEHLIVGDLTGGEANCDNPVNDYYAKLYNAWDDYAENDEQLEHWLDPGNTGETLIQGYNPYEDLADYDAKMLAIAAPAEEYCNEYEMNPKIKIQNRGLQTLTSLKITYQFDQQQQMEYSWSGSLEVNQAEIVSLPEILLNSGEHVFQVELSRPNGNSDANTSNNSKSSEFFIREGNPHRMLLETDNFGFETTWELRNEANEVIYRGGPYTSNNQFTRDFCLETGCYTFVIKDKAGDGFCCDNGQGSLKVFNRQTGDTLVRISSFNWVAEQTFCTNGSTPAYDLAVSADSMKSVWCQNQKQQPVLIVSNRGANPVQAFSLQLDIHGNNLQKSWSGTLMPNERVAVRFDAITPDVQGTFTAAASVSLPGEEDLRPENDTLAYDYRVAEGRKIRFELLTDDFGSETTWELLQDGEVLYSGGPYKDNVNRLFEKEFCLPLGCYKLKVYDAIGDGICCGWSGDGYYSLLDVSEGNHEMIRGAEFGNLDETGFCIYPLQIEEAEAQKVLKLYPNPAQQQVNLKMKQTGRFQIEVLNTTGKVVRSAEFFGARYTLPLKGLHSGIYFVRIQGKEMQIMKKLMVMP